jgi:hypothetical protein
MSKETSLQLFESKQIRSLWNEEEEKWYFSIVDTVEILTESPNPRKYWSVLKTRLKVEGSQLATNCSQLKLPSADGKFYKTDVADTEQLLRLIQSIPSPKTEPFKQWLAEVGTEKLNEVLSDSFQDNLLVPPVYTRPEEFRSWKVPDVLLSGNHKLIDEWRHEQSVKHTKEKRPDFAD